MVLSPQAPEFFSIIENYAIYQPATELTKEEAVDLVDQAVLYCRENKIGGLIADITLATGLPRPSVSDVFWFITRWAGTAAGEVAIAMVAPAEMITPDRIGITVATNRGLRSEIFTNADDARDWISSILPESKLTTGQLD